MRMTSLAFGGALMTAVGLLAPMPGAQAEDSIYIPLLTYRTGPFSGSGTPIANGLHDYLTLLNERDGGIGGVKIAIEECETGYDTKKGVECYEAVKGKNPVILNPWSTGITLQLIPRAGVDKIPILSMAYGLSAAADGDVFPWVFNPPLTYWDGASVFIKHIADLEGGFDKLRGKKIGLIYLDAPYGKEPIPLLQSLAKDYGFDLKLYPVAASEMQNQASLWLNVRRDRADYIYIQGWGAMNPTAVQEAAKNNFPMNHLFAVWWSGGDDDARPAGDAAKGYTSLTFNAAGTDFPAIQDILKRVVATGKSGVAAPDKVGEMLYNRGVFNSVLMAEAIRNAQQLTGRKAVNGEDVRRGLESLNLSAARLKDIGLADFAAPVRVSCADHSGHHGVYLAVWDGHKWTKGSDWIEPLKDKVMPLIEADAQKYAAANPAWPKRTEACDKSS
jgi:branched-chain amino acid transport system substrate-binding protein